MAQTWIRDVKESTENIPSSRRVRDVDTRIHYLDPDAAPFTLISARSNSRTVTNSKYEWIEKDLPGKWTAVNDSTYTDATLDKTFIVDDASIFYPHDVIKDVNTGEVMRVTNVTVTTNTIEVIRAVDGNGTTGQTLADNHDLVIIGTAFSEGSSSPNERSHVETYVYNYTQIHKLAFGVTGTESVSENYTGPDRPRLRREKGIEFKINMERTALFGERALFNTAIGSSETDTGGNANTPRRYTGGFFYFCDPAGSVAKVKDAGGVLTEGEMESWLQDVFTATASGNTRVLFASPLVISVLDQIAVARMQVTPRESTYGLATKTWVTGHGELMIVKHRLLENGPNDTSNVGYGHYAIAVDASKIGYCPLRGRDTKLFVDIQANDLDAYKDMYQCESGWMVQNPQCHGILKGVTG